MKHGDDLGGRSRQDHSTLARIERLAEIEARIDPSLRRRGRVIADLVTIALVTPLAITFDFHVTRPLVMLTLLGGALALNRLVPMVTERRLRAERSRLLAELGPSRRGLVDEARGPDSGATDATPM